jgi:hypothetical protein
MKSLKFMKTQSKLCAISSRTPIAFHDYMKPTKNFCAFDAGGGEIKI